MSKKPEPNPGALVATDPKALAVANRQMRIAGQALARIEQERYIEFFATHPQASRAFIKAVSVWYPLAETMVEHYADWWEWEWLSWNKALRWSEALIERYTDRWDWKELSANKGLPWSEELIERYEDRVHWWQLLNNDAVPWTERMISRYLGGWDTRIVSSAEALPWSDSLIASYSDRWAWEQLSKNCSLPWSESLIERYTDQWYWDCLSWNKALPWSESLIERYTDRWDWRGLSCNRALPWSESLIERYADWWDWGGLSENEALPWSESLIERYTDRWDWRGLSSNRALPWSESLIECYTDQWHWDCLSWNKALPWSESLIERYADWWDWGGLSENEALPWSESLLDRYAHRWEWLNDDGQFPSRFSASGQGKFPGLSAGLSGNAALPWSEALIERYAHRWYWDYLPSAGIRKILPQWSEATIRAVMDRMVLKAGVGNAGGDQELTVAGRRYLLHPDGTVTDTHTGLMWMRCSLGQTWDGTTCRGEAKEMNWHEALEQTGDGFAGYSDWRLPTIDELRTLVYCSSGKPKTWNDTDDPCEGDYQQPTIASAVFPNTPPSWFWSSSSYAGHPGHAWAVFFYEGYVYHDHKLNYSHVRLVRAGQ